MPQMSVFSLSRLVGGAISIPGLTSSYSLVIKAFMGTLPCLTQAFSQGAEQFIQGFSPERAAAVDLLLSNHIPRKALAGSFAGQACSQGALPHSTQFTASERYILFSNVISVTCLFNNSVFSQ
jgi:hypothetical protein